MWIVGTKIWTRVSSNAFQPDRSSVVLQPNLQYFNSDLQSKNNATRP